MIFGKVFFFRKPGRYDLVFSSGAFTIPWDDNHFEMVANTIKKLFDKCNYGFSFKMLSSFTLFKAPGITILILMFYTIFVIPWQRNVF